MKYWKRLFSLLVLAAVLAALCVPALAAPGGAVSAAAGAAVSSFSDITDPTVGSNADLLRFMGVVNGTGDNSFNPNGTLTRAEFCAMLIRVMGRESQVAGQMNRTVFEDVGSTHWARGYVNLAASKENSLIAGVGSGKFEPDAAIKFGQAVTILIRSLGYKDEEVGSVWPADHVTKAAELGLSKGLTVTANQTITRAQAAQLFVNLLTCKTASGGAYYAALGEAKERVILFGADGNGGVRTSAGDFLLPAQLPASMDMQQGVLVTKGDKVVVFLANASGVDITLSDKAAEKYLKTASATYTVADNAKVYVPDEEGPAGSMKETSYEKLRAELDAGVRLTAYFTGSRISELCLRYAGTSLSPQGDVVIITGAATEATFYRLTGGASGMRIVKDGSAITMDQLQPNDVVTYNPVTNTLTASGLRIPVVYDAASPNARAPEKIKLAGLDKELEVLPCAADALSKYRPGDSFTVLLTADGKVAGVLADDARENSTAVGIWDGNSVSVPLADGKKLTFEASSPIPAGQLVTVSASAYSRKEAAVSRVTTRTIPGDFDIKAMTLGGYAVAAQVHVYDRFGTSGPAVPVDPSLLTEEVIPAEKITVYHLNTSGMVDALVLNNVTGNLYTYGILWKGQKPVSSGGGFQYYRSTANIENSSRSAEDKDSGPIFGLAFTDGAFGGLIESDGKVVSLVELTAVSGVSAGDFFTLDGVQYVSAGGRVYPLARDAEGKLAVECYNSAEKTWFTGEKPVEQAKAYGSTLTVYVDPVANAVRAVAAD